MTRQRSTYAWQAVLIAAILCAAPDAANGQPVIDPRFVEFTRSVDHDQVFNGIPVVEFYSLSIFTQGAATPVDTIDLGKPTPDASGNIRVAFVPLLHFTPVPGAIYEARVSAVGSGGTSASTLSNSFSFQATCAPVISPTSQNVAAAGATGSVTVTAGAGCGWTATSGASWLTVTAGASGSGNGSVTFSASANSTLSARTGTLTIAGQTFTVNQAAGTCSYSITPTSQSAAASGGTGSTTVSALAGCAWTATSNASWVTITSGASGSGPGTVNFSVAANPASSVRNGTLTVAGQTFTVNQAAGTCSYSITPASHSAAATGGTGSTTVSVLTGCAWTATSNASWVTITSGASGSGGGTVNFSVASNPAASTRSGTLTVAGQTFTVNQAAAPCSYSINPTSQSVGAGGGSGSTTVSASAGCGWTATSNAGWVTITSGASGSGGGTVNFSASANTAASPRSGTLTVAGQTFTVNQAAAGCTFSISPTSQSVAAAGGTGSTAVTTLTGCAWTASSSASWLTISSGATGTGNGNVAFSAAANPTALARSATLTVAGQIFTVNQAAAACTYSINPTSQSLPSTGGSGSTNVTSPTGCNWTATSNAGWLTVTAGATGSANGIVTFSGTANPNASTRSGTLTVAGQTFTVNQAAAGCTFSISPTSQSVVAAGGTGSTTVTTLSGCAWTASSGANWLTITSGASGTGNGTVAFSVAANPAGAARSATLTVAGQTFTVNQSAASCAYSISPTSQSMGSGGGTGSSTVTTAAGCTWVATSNANWLTITSGASGSGGGTVAFSGAANPSSQARTGTMTIAGQTFSVNQSAASCNVTISPTSQSVAFGGGTGTSTVTAGGNCAWTATSAANWLSITSGASGTGNGTVAFSAAMNPDAAQRTGTLTIGGRSFTVTQDANPCNFLLTPDTRSIGAGSNGGIVSVSVAPSCAWTVQSNVAWISASGSGPGAGSFGYQVAPNTGPSSRTGTVVVGPRTFTVVQGAPAVPTAPGGLTIIVR